MLFNWGHWEAIGGSCFISFLFGGFGLQNSHVSKPQVQFQDLEGWRARRWVVVLDDMLWPSYQYCLESPANVQHVLESCTKS